VVDFFTPCNQKFLNQEDIDMGSSAPIFLPGDLIMGGGKLGELYVMKKNSMGGFQPGAPPPPPRGHCPSMQRVLNCKDSDKVLQRVDATGGHIHGAAIYWKGPASKEWVYLMGEGDNLKAFPFLNGHLQDNPQQVKKSAYRPPPPGAVSCGDCPIMNWMPGGVLTVSSDADRRGTGIVWALVPANGDANSYRGVKGMLIAINAEDVTKELWRSQGKDASVDTPDSFGLLARFNPPVVANGKVFVPNAGDQESLHRYCPGQPRPNTFPQNYALVVYGLK